MTRWYICSLTLQFPFSLPPIVLSQHFDSVYLSLSPSISLLFVTITIPLSFTYAIPLSLSHSHILPVSFTVTQSQCSLPISHSLSLFSHCLCPCHRIVSLSFPLWHTHWFFAFVSLLSHIYCFLPNPITKSNYSVSDPGKSRRWEHSSQISANAYRFQTARVSVIDLYLIYLLWHPLLLSEWKDKFIRILSLFYPSHSFTTICSILLISFLAHIACEEIMLSLPSLLYLYFAIFSSFFSFFFFSIFLLSYLFLSFCLLLSFIFFISLFSSLFLAFCYFSHFSSSRLLSHIF